MWPPKDIVVQARVVAHVDKFGKATAVDIVYESVEGAGDAARDCLLSTPFLPALDANGSPIPGQVVLGLKFFR